MLVRMVVGEMHALLDRERRRLVRLDVDAHRIAHAGARRVSRSPRRTSPRTAPSGASSASAARCARRRRRSPCRASGPPRRAPASRDATGRCARGRGGRSAGRGSRRGCRRRARGHGFAPGTARRHKCNRLRPQAPAVAHRLRRDLLRELARRREHQHARTRRAVAPARPHAGGCRRDAAARAARMRPSCRCRSARSRSGRGRRAARESPAPGSAWVRCSRMQQSLAAAGCASFSSSNVMRVSFTIPLAARGTRRSRRGQKFGPRQWAGRTQNPEWR